MRKIADLLLLMGTGFLGAFIDELLNQRALFIIALLAVIASICLGSAGILIYKRAGVRVILDLKPGQQMVLKKWSPLEGRSETMTVTRLKSAPIHKLSYLYQHWYKLTPSGDLDPYDLPESQVIEALKGYIRIS